MMSGIPGPPPGGGPLNGSLVNPNSVVTESFSDQNLLPDVQGVKSDVIKPEVTTIKEEVSVLPRWFSSLDFHLSVLLAFSTSNDQRGTW